MDEDALAFIHPAFEKSDNESSPPTTFEPHDVDNYKLSVWVLEVAHFKSDGFWKQR